MTNSLNRRRARFAYSARLGFTLVEILTSVTLSLMLMYAVARIFTRVGGTMNETTSIMSMSSQLRNAKDTLTADLEGVTCPIAPPRNSNLNDGYLCYVEGMGAPINRLYADFGGPRAFSTQCTALDTERYLDHGLNANAMDGLDVENYLACDNTVGDMDDILSFTTRAPEGSLFKARYIEPIRNDSGVITGAQIGIYETEYAEVVWFLRGTTLYRRVLPIIPDSVLQDSLNSLTAQGIDDEGNAVNWRVAQALGISDPERLQKGMGFYRYYDVSVHMGNNGWPVANTLGDLTNRANRYGVWLPIAGKDPTFGTDPNGNPSYGFPGAYPGNPNDVNYTGADRWDGGQGYGYARWMHGLYGSWYWLRMPTMQESANVGFRAGAPFGSAKYGLVWDDIARADALQADNDQNNPKWNGYNQKLTFLANPDTPLNADTEGGALPLIDDAGYNMSGGSGNLPVPFIDYWNNPNVWGQVNAETGDLNYASPTGNDVVYTSDVILTNVLSFNVRAWDSELSDYVDLGSGSLNDPSISGNNPDNLRSFGYYSDGASLTENMPCVYDTWSEQYQKNLYAFDSFNNTNVANSSNSTMDIDSMQEISSSQLLDFPPPYNVPLKSLQVEIRVFDPRSKQIRNATFVVDWSLK
ncbi:MAG: PilW family protein [Thermoguttaceae bacterium]